LVSRRISRRETTTRKECHGTSTEYGSIGSAVQGIHSGFKESGGAGIPHLKDDPKIVDQAIADCKEILDVVMEGDVKQWLS
jgi:hypothetical protein